MENADQLQVKNTGGKAVLRIMFHVMLSQRVEKSQQNLNRKEPAFSKFKNYILFQEINNTNLRERMQPLACLHCIQCNKKEGTSIFHIWKKNRYSLWSNTFLQST